MLKEQFLGSQKLVREGDALHQIPSQATFANSNMQHILYDCKDAPKPVDVLISTIRLWRMARTALQAGNSISRHSTSNSWRQFADGTVGIVTILNERMHQMDRQPIRSVHVPLGRPL
jgi:hypothetical protein